MDGKVTEQKFNKNGLILYEGPSILDGELITMGVGGLPLTVGRVGYKYYLIVHRFIG